MGPSKLGHPLEDERQSPSAQLRSAEGDTSASLETAQSASARGPRLRVQFSWGWLLVVIGALVVLFGPALCEEWHDGPILRSGIAAKARVLDIRPTGNTRHEDQQVRIDLEVQPSGREPYRARTS